jgi:transglutaminase-like putative cysteine protease
VLLAIFGFVAAVSLLLAAGRPLLASTALLIGVGLPATIASAGAVSSPLRTGALLLAALLFILYLTRKDVKPLRGAVAAAGLGAVLVLVAVAASTSPAVAKDAFVGWDRWDLYDAPTEPVGVRYVWASNYSGIAYPEKETVVLRIKAPDDALYWRATTLDDYTGVGWREDLTPGPPLAVVELVTPADPLLPEAAREEASWTRQEVEVVALADTHLIAASQPVKWQFPAQNQVQSAEGGVVLQPRGLTQGERYTVWSYVAEPKPDELATLPARYPPDLRRFLDVVPDVRLPAFGAANRDQVVEAAFAEGSGDRLLQQYLPLYQQARELVGEAKSPYVAAATLEAWFRGEGGFEYNEQPPQAVGTVPPLVDFVLRTRQGYCQHFAGAMAVMLRLLGIPARVAAGFTSGDYNSGRDEWVVTDHNAHTWVEVWFPKYGWLAFDPTPARGSLDAEYSSASPDFGAGGINSLGISPNALSPLLRQRLGQAAGTASGAAGGLSSSSGGEDGGIGIPGLTVISVFSAIAFLLIVKLARRELRFRRRDPRSVAVACRRDLIGYLADQGVTVEPSVTLEELGGFLERRYRVDATSFARAANAARFGPPGRAEAAARRARRELRALRRELRGRLSVGSRTRGVFSLRSLTA